VTTKQTPAQKAGFIVNVTRLKLTGNDGDYSETEYKSKVWILSNDDGSSCPYFKSEHGDVECFCAYVRDMSIIEEVAPVPAVPQLTAVPKFPVGSSVKVVNSGWGFGPEMIGTVLTVTDFKLRGFEDTTYHLIDSEGQRQGGDIWEPCLELAPPLLPVSVAPALTLDKAPLQVVYTELQQLAINTFQGMYDAALRHREGLDSRLNGEYGICDNIDRFSDMAGANSSQMSEVKENLIRVTPIYSGNYTYPVPCPTGGDAGNAFTRHSNKWREAYGLNRLTQLGQLIDIIKSDKWSDDMVKRQTPAFRNGLVVGDIVRYTRRDVPSFWVFRRDDESMSPSFHKLLDKDDYTDIDLNYIVKVDRESVFKVRSVSEFLSTIAEQVAKKADIERQIAELQSQLQGVQSEVAMLDFGLADQHKVKRI
jgi:hypothetical protein